MSKNNGRISLGIRQKTAVSTVLAMTALTVMMAIMGYQQYKENVTEKYIRNLNNVLYASGMVFEEYHFGDMIREREMPPAYDEVREELNLVKSSTDVSYLYAVYFEDEAMTDLRYAINAKDPADLAGSDSPESLFSYMGDVPTGDTFTDEVIVLYQEAIRTNSFEIGYAESKTQSYGYLLSAFDVIRDSEGIPVGIAGVDIDITEIYRELIDYIKNIMVAAALFTGLVIFLSLRNTRKTLTNPLEGIAKASDEFVKKMEAHVLPENLTFTPIRVTTQDEIKVLADNVKSMADGVQSYMTDLASVTAEKERISTELSVARDIQASALPRNFEAFSDRPEFDLYASMDPAKEVGGDFYDFFLVDEDHLVLVMADVSGKGVPAALLMMVAKKLIKHTAHKGGRPAQILEEVNTDLCEGNKEDFFVTVWLAIIELSTGKGIAANAGHEHPALRKAGGEYELVIYRHSPAVGTMEDIPFKEHTFELSPGDDLFVYTDGVPEATNEDNELFGTDRMLAALNADPNRSPKEILKKVTEDIETFVAGAEQFDDTTMLCFKYYGPKR